MRCQMCDCGAASIEYKGYKICDDCSKELNRDMENIPVICNGNVIGVVKSKVGGIIECNLWDRFIGTETKDGKCVAIIIG